MMLQILKFSNNVHEAGKVQVTVRRGTKWGILDVGGDVGLQGLNEGSIAHASVVLVHKCTLHEIPEYMLDMEHDPECRSYLGLKRELERVYDDRIDSNEVITVIGYQLRS